MQIDTSAQLFVDDIYGQSNGTNRLVLDDDTRSGLANGVSLTGVNTVYICCDETNNGTGEIQFLKGTDNDLDAGTAVEFGRFDNSGRLGIGETSIDANLHITGAPTVIKMERAGVRAMRFGVPDNSSNFVFADADNLKSSQRMVIDNSGLVGIGTTAPYERLYVECEDVNSPGIVSNPAATNGAIAYAIGYGDANRDYLNTWGMEFSGGGSVFGYGLKPHSGSAGVFVNSADNSNFTRGALLIDNELRFFTAGATTGTIDTTITTTERMRIETDGEAHFDGDVVAFSSTVSDKRLKENVIEIDGALDTIQNLRGVTFNWKDELKVSEKRRGKLDYGFIAQEVEAILPELVKESKSLIRESKDGPKEEETIYKTVSYPKVIPILVEAVKELTTEIEDLKKEIKKLKK
jgi:hypothetical protein